MRGLVDDVLLVDDATILRAMRLLLHHTGLLAEPAGVVGVAAILEHRNQVAGQRVAAPLCGGNVTREQFQEWFLE
jgi:threonine dehydratase